MSFKVVLIDKLKQRLDGAKVRLSMFDEDLNEEEIDEKGAAEQEEEEHDGDYMQEEQVDGGQKGDEEEAWEAASE